MGCSCGCGTCSETGPDAAGGTWPWERRAPGDAMADRGNLRRLPVRSLRGLPQPGGYEADGAYVQPAAYAEPVPFAFGVQLRLDPLVSFVQQASRLQAPLDEAQQTAGHEVPAGVSLLAAQRQHSFDSPYGAVHRRLYARTVGFGASFMPLEHALYADQK